MSCIVYKLKDFDQIKQNGISYSLPQETIDIIKKISANVGAPEYVKTPFFEKKTVKHTNKYQHQHQQNQQQNTSGIKDITLDNWNAVRNFKPTVMEKKKGIELSVDKIRKSLNKITDKTYEKMLLQIIEEIDLIFNENDITETGGKLELDENYLGELNRIGDSIFDIASGNGFYSKMYAKMSKVLMDKYDFMNEIFKNKMNTDIYLFSDYAYCSPDSDYDQFCRNNKLNEKRRALVLFYINLMIEGIVEEDKMIKMIEDIQEKLIQEIAKDNNSNIVEEMSEIIYIMITHGASTLKKSTDSIKGKWKEIIDRVNVVSCKKHKSEPSITNKTIFKHLDMMSFVNKK